MMLYQGLDIPKAYNPQVEIGVSPEWEDFNNATERLKQGDSSHEDYGGLFTEGADLSPTLMAHVGWTPTEEQKKALWEAKGSNRAGQSWSKPANTGTLIYSGDDDDSKSRAAIADTLLAKEAQVEGLYKSQGVYHIGIGHLLPGIAKEEDGHQTKEALDNWLGSRAFRKHVKALRESPHTEAFRTHTDEDFKSIFRMEAKLTEEEVRALYKHDLDKRIGMLRGDSGKGVGAEFYDSLSQKEKENLVSALYRGDLGGKTAEAIRGKKWGKAIREGFRNYEIYKKLAKGNAIDKSEWGNLDEKQKDKLMQDLGAYEFKSGGGVKIKAKAKGSPVQERLVAMLKMAEKRYNKEHAPKAGDGGRVVVKNEKYDVSQLRDEDGKKLKRVKNGTFLEVLNSEPFKGYGGQRVWVMVDGEKASIPLKHIAANLGQMKWEKLNLRADVGTNSKVLTTLERKEGERGPQLEVLGVKKGWANVRWTKGKKTHKGWVKASLIKYNEHIAKEIG